MTARRTKSNTTKAVATTDDPFEPINLDPPNPAITRWEALAERDVYVHHDGDAEKMLGHVHPRPAWADPEQDTTGRSHLSTSYGSLPVRVVASHNWGKDHGDWWEPAVVWVSAKFYGNRHETVQLTFSQIDDSDGRWQNVAMSFQPDEARYLVEVLQAAIDLFGGDQ
ncbi:hypothetical protein AB4Z39_12865 [Mycobacterium adipatum]|uniref:hypothetical protein n=1 Tax=Mycobacterium adipatum TaxID=1682113 RepID=UPI0034E0B46A